MKRMLVVCSACVLLLVAGACGRGGTATTASPTEFRIASPVDRTGSDAAVGKFWSTGLDAAVKAVNAGGGILGRKVVVDYSDTQSNPQTASQVANDMLASGKYQALIPAASNAMSQPILQAVNRSKILAVGTGPLLDMGDPTKYPTVFDVKYDAQAQGEATGCLAATFHPKRVAFLHIDDPFPTAQIKAMTPILTSGGAQIVADEAYPFAATDITAQVQKIKQAQPDVLVLFAYFNSLSVAIKAINTVDLTGVQVVGDAEVAAAPPSSFLAAGTPLPKNIVAMQWQINSRVDGKLSAAQQTAVDAISPGIDGKFSAVLATYLYTYDALKLIKWAAEKANSDKTTDMVKELETLGAAGNPGPGTFITADPPYSATTHRNGGPMYAVNIAGEYVGGTFPALYPIPACAS
jgi:ABC-type branched-subunit amino acid transport system substrate-binding protein